MKKYKKKPLFGNSVSKSKKSKKRKFKLIKKKINFIYKNKNIKIKI